MGTNLTNISMKRRVYNIIELSKTFTTIMLVLIGLNVIAIILESVKYFDLRFSTWFWLFEIFSVSVFTVEYLLRLWTVTEQPKYKDFIKGRIRFSLTPLALVDLFAVLPFYLPMFMPFDLRFLRAFRIFRIIRILKMGRYVDSLKVLADVIFEKRGQLIITALYGSLLLITSSCIMYYFENPLRPDVFSSIPASMWWGIVTLTTVGYGDIFPITPMGKLFGAVISLIGIGLFALPAGIIAAGLVERISEKKEDVVQVCPHCGKKIH